MDLLRYEFIEAPEDSMNGMVHTLVKGIRYNREYATLEEFKKMMPTFHLIESRLQQLDADIRLPKRNYVQDIMDELDKEQENETNISDDLKHATIATIKKIFGRDFQYDELQFNTGTADQYHFLQLDGYTDNREVDANLIIVKDVFRAICNKYNYIFIDLSN